MLKVRRVMPVLIDAGLYPTIQSLPVGYEVHPSATYQLVKRLLVENHLTVPVSVWDKFPPTLTVKDILKGMLSTPLYFDVSSLSVPPPISQHVSRKIKEILNQIQTAIPPPPTPPTPF
jgi:hypothetical protein